MLSGLLPTPTTVNHAQGTVKISGDFIMNAHPVGAGLDEDWGIGVWIFDH